MNWINFFKPTFKKVLIIILIIVLFVPWIYYDTGIRCIQAPCPAGQLGSIAEYFFSSHEYDIYAEGLRYKNLIIWSIISYLVVSVIWYIKK